MKKEIELRKRQIGHVVVIAPPSSGKSILLGKLRGLLEELGATVIEERPQQEPLGTKFKDWELEMLKSTVRVLREQTCS
jgi:hypothetical protein